MRLQILKINVSYIKFIIGLVILTGLTILTITAVFAQDQQQLNLINTSTFQSLTGIPYPNIQHENPDAVKHTEKFTPPKVIKVTDAVYSTVGYGMANVMMVEGTDGIIIVDAGENDVQAKKSFSRIS